MVDTHTHIYLKEFDSDRADMIQRAKDLGINKVYLPAIDSLTHQAMVKVADESDGFAIPMMGLHPCSVNENYNKELGIVYEWLHTKKFCAIGEIGLDYYWDTSTKDIQKSAFRAQMEMATEMDLPIVIHSRESTSDCLEMISEYVPKGIRGVFHCFGGTLQEAEKIISMGFYLGIGGVLTYKKSMLDLILSKIPLERIVLETDAPYLTPVPFRGKRNEPSYLIHIAQKVSELYQLPLESIIEKTTKNAELLFGNTSYCL